MNFYYECRALNNVCDFNLIFLCYKSYFLFIYLFYFSLLFNAGICQTIAEAADIEGPTPPPKFITRGHLYKAVIGDTIILPCKVKDLG